jgi:hypothetical protein
MKNKPIHEEENEANKIKAFVTAIESLMSRAVDCHNAPLSVVKFSIKNLSNCFPQYPLVAFHTKNLEVATHNIQPKLGDPAVWILLLLFYCYLIPTSCLHPDPFLVLLYFRGCLCFSLSVFSRSYNSEHLL